MPADRREELLGRLLSVPLDGFVEQRNALVREVRSAGDRETAAWLASLRRPSPGVWALDQVANRDPARVLGLIDVGDQLAGAQARAMRGDSDAAAEMRELSGSLKRAVDDVVRQAGEVLRDAGHGVSTDTMLGMATTLRNAIASDEEVRHQLAAGLLLQPVESTADFGFVAAAVGPARPELRVLDGGAGESAAARQQRRDDEERARQRQRLVQAAEAAEREAASLQAAAEELRARVALIGDRLRAVEAELDAAHDAAQTADAAARDALARARAARRDADAAETQGVPG